MTAFPFEQEDLEQLRRIRQMTGEFGPLTSYVAPGIKGGIAWSGDLTAPYMHLLTRASADGVTGSKPVVDSEPQRILSDAVGRLWIRDSKGVVQREVFHTAALAPSATINAEAGFQGRLFQARMIVNEGLDEARFLQLFDATGGTPVNGTEPMWEALAPPDTAFVETADDFSPVDGIPFTTGQLILCCSTTPGTLTIAGDDAIFMATYATAVEPAV